MKQYDIAVIGGGPAGYIAAIKGAQLGCSVILFEKSVVGGTCLNRGCIPTKTYLKGAEMIRHIRMAKQYGILNDPSISIDMNKAVDNKNRVVKQLTSGVAALLKSNGIEVINQEAALSSETTIISGDCRYQAKNIILCGGSKSSRIPIPGVEHENVLTSDEILDLKVLPKRLAIIGGGVIGCELASAFHGYGSHITIIEAENRILPQMDVDISKGMKAHFEQDNINVLTSQKVEKITHQASESMLHLAGGKTIVADKILLSIGRSADLSCLGDLQDKIVTEHGKVVADDYMRTNVPNIYAPGDINGKCMLAHAAFKMGETAAMNACGKRGKKVRCQLDYVPGCIYTMPEASGVGLTEAAAVEKYGKEHIAIGKFPFAANGRALASGEGNGFVKVITENVHKEILGVHILGGAATEMISEAVNLLTLEIPADEAASIIHAHPTYSEALMEAFADTEGACMHLPARFKKAEGQ